MARIGNPSLHIFLQWNIKAILRYRLYNRDTTGLIWLICRGLQALVHKPPFLQGWLSGELAECPVALCCFSVAGTPVSLHCSGMCSTLNVSSCFLQGLETLSLLTCILGSGKYWGTLKIPGAYPCIFFILICLSTKSFPISSYMLWSSKPGSVGYVDPGLHLLLL